VHYFNDRGVSICCDRALIRCFGGNQVRLAASFRFQMRVAQHHRLAIDGKAPSQRSEALPHHGPCLKALRGSSARTPANRSMDLECCDRASIRLASAAAVHEGALNSEPTEAVVEPGAGLEVGAAVETWAQAQRGPHDEVEPGSRMRQGNISAASLRAAPAEPDL
jgi:hypothetical protein